jgi:hypothetical protein
MFRRPSDEGPGTTIGVCRPATCTVSTDCPAGMLCIAELSDEYCQPLPPAFHCQTPVDECAGPENCASGSCGYRDGRFICDDSGC